MYVKDTLNAMYINELTGTNDYCDFIYLKINSPSKENLIIGGYYRHCKASSADKVCFIDTLEQHLSHKSLRNSKIIIQGDMNICLITALASATGVFLLEILLIKPARAIILLIWLR